MSAEELEEHRPAGRAREFEAFAVLIQRAEVAKGFSHRDGIRGDLLWTDHRGEEEEDREEDGQARGDSADPARPQRQCGDAEQQARGPDDDEAGASSQGVGRTARAETRRPSIRRPTAGPGMRESWCSWPLCYNDSGKWEGRE